jgi:hypothetical protein
MSLKTVQPMISAKARSMTGRKKRNAVILNKDGRRERW